jgi:drug/metabolite transporter (DMT)-like permease
MEDPRTRARVPALPLLVVAALIAFAANSILCRAALDSRAIDPFAFSMVRVASGAVVLMVLRGVAGLPRRATSAAAPRVAVDWTAAAMLAAYLVPFSWAYTKVQAGSGALLLFGAVQSTLLLAGLRGGERPGAAQWCGMALAVAGLGVLVVPGLEAPPPTGALAMAIAGVAWGFYTLRGRRARDPLAATTANFLAATPLVAAAAVGAALATTPLHLTPQGALLALASGALASALGYVAWYAALRALSATRAAVLQLAVPVLAAAGGVVLLGEPLRQRLVLAAVALLGGVALGMMAPRSRRARRPGLQPSLAPATDSRATWASQIARTRSKVSASAGVLSGR